MDPDMDQYAMDDGGGGDMHGRDYDDDTEAQGPDPSFYLVPLNEAAVAAVQHPLNEALICEVGDGVYALNITLSSESTEVSLGCGGHNIADIYLPGVEGVEISRRHCTFTALQQTGAVVLSDISRRHNTEVYDVDYDRTIPISKALHSVVVSKGFNRRIAIGQDRYYEFELRWNADMLREWTKAGRMTSFGPYGSEPLYVRGADIGAGAFGSVWQAADIHTGSAIAVKRFHTLEGKRRQYANREVYNMFKIKHKKAEIQNRHILEIIEVAQDPKGKWMELLMPLKEGSLKQLAQEHDIDVVDVGKTVLDQMLQALKCIAEHKLVHRDVKPANILWETRYNSDDEPYYHFTLADFGLSHDAAEARTKVGTEPFMAPEAARTSKYRQGTKMDLWSLFATVAWIWDFEDFRRLCWSLNNVRDIHDLLMRFAKKARFHNIRKIAQLNPDKRPSARDLLKAQAYLPVEIQEAEEAEEEPQDADGLAEDMGALDLGEEQPADPFEEGNMDYRSYEPVQGHGHNYRDEYEDEYRVAGPSQHNWQSDAGYGYGGGVQVGESSNAAPRGRGGYEHGYGYQHQTDQYSHGRMDRDYEPATATTKSSKKSKGGKKPGR